MLSGTGLGAVIAALITASLTFAGLILAKEQKVSEFRQDWINALRADVAELYAAITSISGLDHFFPEANGEYWDEAKDIYAEANRATARIRLRLNHTEPPSIALLDVIADVERTLNATMTHNADDIARLELELIERAVFILREEWRRVKAGETVFQMLKAGASAIAVTAAMIAIGMLA